MLCLAVVLFDKADRRAVCPRCVPLFVVLRVDTSAECDVVCDAIYGAWRRHISGV